MRFALAFVLLLGGQTAVQAQPFRVSSPDGTLSVALALDAEGRLTYHVQRFGRDLVTPSRLGVVLTDGRRLDSGLTLLGSEPNTHDETWETVWGERQFVRDHHHERRLSLANADGVRMDVIVRVFDDGLGFRYAWPAQEGLTDFAIADEVTEFNLADEPMAWWIPAYQRERYEYTYRHTPLSEAGRFQGDANVNEQPHPYRPEQVVHTPLTLELPDSR